MAATGERVRNGLNKRTSMFGCASSASEQAIFIVEGNIVQQHAYTYSTVGSGKKRLRHQATDGIVLENVVLRVDGFAA